MINSYRYGDRKNLHKDDEIQELEAPANEILELKGPFLQVTITHPIKIQEKLKRKGLKVSSLHVNALIDTGASFTAVSSKIVDELNLVQTGYQKISSVQDEQV
ncbi:MAG: hypothetical protein JSV88_03090 [Candidatus Aminicenantes bacterium]|nr:MAG: hypothetical protein JSV88_03090 [Candidatus Aminicenantes bacterium]